jgi:2-polyprenyl-6-methoxyphenol hydroxylase-like FAD-dependent oxidoreductase
VRKIKSWHPDLRALIAASESEETFPIAVRVSIPCDPWPAVPITLLGDSIHAMSPAGGSGANMALLDAHLLLQALISVTNGEKPLLQALHEYEKPMLEAGFAAVRFSANGGILNANTTTKKPLLQRLLYSIHQS